MSEKSLSDGLRSAPPLWVHTEEDPEGTIHALGSAVQGRLLCIASGGDTPFALLAAGAHELFAVDINPAQLAITDLKARTLAQLTFEDHLSFWLTPKPEQRVRLYRTLTNWDTSGSVLSLSKWIEALDERPLVDAGAMQGVGTDLSRQSLYRREAITTWLRCGAVRKQQVFYNRYLCGLAEKIAELRQQRAELWFGGTTPPEDDNAIAQAMKRQFISRFCRLIATQSIRGNLFLTHQVLGTYLFGARPIHLQPEAAIRVKPQLPKLRLVAGSLIDVLRELPDASLDGADFSTVPDLLPTTEVDHLFAEARRVLRRGGRVVHRAIIADAAAEPRPGFRRYSALSLALTRSDRSFLYAAVVADEVIE